MARKFSLSPAMLLMLYPTIIDAVQKIQHLKGDAPGREKKADAMGIVHDFIEATNAGAGREVLDPVAGALAADHLIEGTVAALHLKLPVTQDTTRGDSALPNATELP